MVKPNSIGYDRLKRAYNMKRAAPSKLEESCIQELERKAAALKGLNNNNNDDDDDDNNDDGGRSKKQSTKYWDTHHYDWKKRKEPYYLLYQILDAINRTQYKSIPISRIQYLCQMSWCQMKYYFDVLLRGELIERQEVYGIDSKRKRVILSITWRGELYLIKYRDLKRLCFNVSDRLNIFGDIDK